jgi:hypothetical protein
VNEAFDMERWASRDRAVEHVDTGAGMMGAKNVFDT